jgi:hypothetical protein
MAVLLKKLVAIACIVGSGLALNNVYSDVTELQAQANTLACGSHPCAQLISRQRTPLSQDFTFQVQKNSATTAHVVCQREFLLLGTFACETVK